MRSRLAGISGVGVLALLLSGCGGILPGGTGKSGDRTESSGDGSSGTPLEVDTSARKASFSDSDAKSYPLKVAPVSLKRGSADDMAADGGEKSLPYFLTVSVTNNGKDVIQTGDVFENFSVALADGTPAEEGALFNQNPLASPGNGPVERCHSKSGAATLEPGQATQSCRLLLLPKDARPVVVSYFDKSGGAQSWKIKGGGGKGTVAAPLAVGATADTRWKDVDGKEFPLSVTPKSVRKVSIDTLAKQYDLDADAKQSVPYYVTFEYRNNGKTKLYPDMHDELGLRTAGGQLVSKMALIDVYSDGPEGCKGTVPNDMMRPGATVTQCGIYLVPEGDRPGLLVFSPTGAGTTSLVWRAPDA